MSTVLVVDDNAVDRRLVGGLLEKSGGMLVRYASDGAEALEEIQRAVPDVVVTDLVMPQMDGLELVRAVTSKYPRIPLVLMTGHGSEEIAVEALRTGAASYVPKSRLATMLADTVRKLLEVLREQEHQQRLIGRMSHNDCQFELDSDLTLVPAVIHYLIRSLRGVGFHDESALIRISVALEEALNNAIYHGNLELSSELRDLDSHEYRRVVRERRESSPYKERKVRLTANISRLSARFHILDEGPGFDPQSLPDPTDPANLELPSGRGVMLMRTFMDEMEFGPRGNEVTLVKRLVS
jgi:CheY-like chemotaxis protein/anti-sigma regulatory factor (Ser/Thr protein kinase)